VFVKLFVQWVCLLLFLSSHRPLLLPWLGSHSIRQTNGACYLFAEPSSLRTQGWPDAVRVIGIAETAGDLMLQMEMQFDEAEATPVEELPVEEKRIGACCRRGLHAHARGDYQHLKKIRLPAS
jgi:hypothetical protein